MADLKTPPVLVFPQEDADAIYNDLRAMHVDLDADPLSHGPKRLNGKVSEVRRHLDRCERIFLDLSQKLHSARRNHRIKLTAVEMKKKQLIAEDPVTRAGHSATDRDAIASNKLSKEIDEVNSIDVLSKDLEAMLLVVKTKRADLRDVQGRLKDQIQLCREELGLGSRWGSQMPNAPDLHPGKVAADIKEVEKLLGNVEGEIHLQQKKGEWQDPPVMDLTAVAQSPEKAPETKPVEKPSAVLPEEPEKDLAVALPQTAPQDAVDGFLGKLEESDKKAEGESLLKDETLDSILETFEKVD